MHPSIQGIGWFWRRVPDPDPVIAWYRDVVGLPELRGRAGESAMLYTGDTSVLWITRGAERPPELTERSQQTVIPVLRCRDIDAVEKRLVAGGGRLLQGGTTHDSRLSYVVDPSGNITGLQSRAAHMSRIEDQEADRRWAAGLPVIEGIPPLPKDIQGLDWVLVFTPEPARSIAFYQEVLGLPMTDPRAKMLYLGETALMGNLPGGAAPPRPQHRNEVPNGVILRVHGLDAMMAAMKAQGVEFLNEDIVTRDDAGKLAYFFDPQGVLVGLQERMPISERAEDREATRRWAARGG